MNHFGREIYPKTNCEKNLVAAAKDPRLSIPLCQDPNQSGLNRITQSQQWAKQSQNELKQRDGGEENLILTTKGTEYGDSYT
jgi:hypothetical protein